MAQKKNTDSDGTVAAEDQLAALDAPAVDPHDQLERDVESQKKLRDEQLAAGAGAEAGLHQEAVDKGDISAARNAASGLGGVVIDNYTRRNANEAMHGHFCTVDLNHEGVKDGYKAAGLVDDDGNYTHRGDYGVFAASGESDPETGYPVTAVVRLRDETGAGVTVPYEALRHAASRGI